MKYNFDEPVNRKGTESLKYEGMTKLMGVDDAIPMWVADMDFNTAPCIIDTIKRRLEHEVFGYTLRTDRFFGSIAHWMKKRHSWEIKTEWINFSPGAVAGFTLSIQQLTQPGDQIIVQPPVYFPFFQSVADTGREVVYNPLILKDGRYYMDFEDLKKKIALGAKTLIISNPHNPGGSVWTKEELTRLSEICNAGNVLVVSDEIHADLVYKPARFIPYASISEEAAMNSVTVSSHSKTFNVAGLTTSYVIIPNTNLMKGFDRGLHIPHLHMGNIFGNEALIAAYTHGDEWLDELLIYLKGNIDLIDEFARKYLPELKIIRPESTFLVWIDCRGLGLSGIELRDFFLKKAKVAINEGSMFGPGGEGFVRLNVGCTRAQLQKALNQIKENI
jgi:cysteine-S-conjugate beta-lyase